MTASIATAASAPDTLTDFRIYFSPPVFVREAVRCFADTLRLQLTEIMLFNTFIWARAICPILCIFHELLGYAGAQVAGIARIVRPSYRFCSCLKWFMQPVQLGRPSHRLRLPPRTTTKIARIVSAGTTTSPNSGMMSKKTSMVPVVF